MVTFTTVGFGDLTITGYNLKFVIVAFSYFGYVTYAAYNMLIKYEISPDQVVIYIQTCMDWYRHKLSHGKDSISE